MAQLVVYNYKPDFDISNLDRQGGIEKLQTGLANFEKRFRAEFPNIKVASSSWLNCTLLIEVPENDKDSLRKLISEKLDCEVGPPAIITRE